MTVPAAPLPSLGNLLKALTAPESGAERWTRDSAYEARFYRRGSVALAAAIEAARKAANASTATVWLPDYFCNEALEPARRRPVELRFYPVDEELVPNFQRISQEIRPGSDLQLFVLVHYFGFHNATSEARMFCDQNGIVLVEDSAHMLKPGAGVGLGELMIFSPRKVLALPSGGLLLASSQFNGFIDQPAGENDWFEALSWAGRRLIQSVLVKLHFPWHRLQKYDEVDADVEAGPAPANEPEAYNSYALRLLEVTESGFDEIFARRRSNYAQLLKWITGSEFVRPLFANLPDDACPYALPLLVEPDCREVVAKLKVAGVMASRWPDLPPEVSARKGSHQTAVRLYERLVLLPIHQSLQAKDIDMIGSTLQGILNTRAVETR